MLVTKESLTSSVKALNSRILAVDTETTGLDPYTSSLRLLQISDGTTTLVFDLFKLRRTDVADALRPLFENKKIIKVFHNAKFDLKFIWRHLDIRVEGIFDSYLASQLIECGVHQASGYHGLAQCLERYCGITISKDEQKSDWSGQLTDEQIAYAEKDVEVLLPLRDAMVKKLYEMDLARVAKIEFECVLPVVWMEMSGIYLDMKDWIALAERHQEKANALYEEIVTELAPHIPQQTLFGLPNINLGSVQQVKHYLTLAGVPMPESTREFELKDLVPKYPIVGKYIDWKRHTKASTSFGEGYREFINPVTNRIHSQFNQMGTITGRFSCSQPNTNQIPADNEHRNCFKAEGKNTLVSCDVSQAELRLLAELSDDPVATQAFNGTADYHRIMASNVFNKDPEDVTDSERTFAKRLSFGLVYGISPGKFALQCGISENKARSIMNGYFKSVPQQKKWIDAQKHQVLRTRQSRTVAGRITKYDFDIMDGKSTSKAQRNATNSPLQGSVGDIIKLAMRLFYNSVSDKLNEVKLVNVVHDQIDIEVPEDKAQFYGELLQQCMLDACHTFVKNVQMKVDMKISKLWAK